MKITVVSDTHNDINSLEKVLEISKNSDIIFHLGDNLKDAEYLKDKFNGEVYMVKGNCDYEVYGEKDLVVEVEGYKFFLTHGDKYRVNYDLNNLYYRGIELNANIILFGHTHRKTLIKNDDIVILNPGSISLPRDNSKSVAEIIIKNKQINFDFLEF